MLKTYKGYYENGNFILDERDQAEMPDKTNFIITLLEDEVSLEAKQERQKKAVKRFLEAMDRINQEEWTEEEEADFRDFQNGKYKPHFPERL